jgi:protein-disulfide isomerase
MLATADKARIQGSSAAPVWIVEVSDFQCPYCKMWHDSTYATIKREFIATGQVRMAYVNFPLQGHANAVPAAKAAMCAALQGRFWEMHDALFDSQETWAPLRDPMPKLESLATGVGVKPSEWRECVNGQVIQRLINADRQRGDAAGVTSTPFFFVGDEVIRGAAPASAFRAAILRARQKAAAGTTR